jgi:Family of unknown function (DUF6516)
LAYHTNMKAAPIRHSKVTDELGNTIEIKLWEVPQTQDKLHGFKYSLAYMVAGRREIGYDNAEGKGDHRHHGEKEEPYTFTTLSKLADDFLTDVETYKRDQK